MALLSSGITDLVARAGRAFIAAKGTDPVLEGAQLAEWLRSDAPILPGDRELLAQLVTGDWRRPAGRPAPLYSERQDVLSAYRHRRETFGSGGSQAAKMETASEFGISIRQVERIDSEARKREIAIATAEAKVAK